MPFCQIPDVAVGAVAVTVPATVRKYAEEAAAYGGNIAQLERIAKSVGLVERRVAAPNQTALDLCVHAAEHLLNTSVIAGLRGKIDGLLFVTQSPDYFQPCNATLAHGKLGLREDCAAFDVGLGCSGYVYGLWLAHQLINSGGCENVLLMAGDTMSKAVHQQDRAVAPLFGDAGSATLLHRAKGHERAGFLLKSEGTAAHTISIPMGGYRKSITALPLVEHTDQSGNTRTDAHLQMDGAEVFNFSLRVAASTTQDLLEKMGTSLDSVDAFFFHQANRFIIQSIARKLKLSEIKSPSDSFSKYGNTSSASIPLALCHHKQANPDLPIRRVACCGFGVGLSWGTSLLTLSESLHCSLLDLASPS